MGKRVVIYVDDDLDDLDYFKEAFEEFAEDYELILYEDSIQLLHYLDQNGHGQLPSLIILDINMPRLNGYDTLKMIRLTREYANIPVMLFSTMPKPFDETFGIKYKAGFLSKPSNSKQMTETLALLLSHAAPQLEKP